MLSGTQYKVNPPRQISLSRNAKDFFKLYWSMICQNRIHPLKRDKAAQRSMHYYVITYLDLLT
jgi:hypothetical protein